MNHVAVLEDEPHLLALIGEVLEERGYRVSGYGTVRAAEVLLQSPPDLLITDRILPDGDGLELLQRLRRVHPRLPVLVISGRAGEEDLLAGFAAGASDYVTKPLSLAELQAKCTVLLSRAGRAPGGEPGAAFSTAAHLPGGRQAAFGRYRVCGVLGQGGAGVVYSAYDEQAGDAPPEVALKVLPADAALDPQVCQRFVREAYALSLIRCPHVVGVRDFGTSEGRYYYAMEAVGGPTLDVHVLKSGPLSQQDAGFLLRGLARALRSVHAAGLLHRDIKPANVILRGGRCEAAVLIDFGLAKQPQDRTVTAQSELVGTPAYLPPEAILGRPLDERSDLFALGQLVRYALTGEDPFEECDLYELLRRLVEAQVELPAGLAGPLARLLDRLTRVDPDERPASAAEVLRELRGPIGSRRARRPV